MKIWKLFITGLIAIAIGAPLAFGSQELPPKKSKTKHYKTTYGKNALNKAAQNKTALNKSAHKHKTLQAHHSKNKSRYKLVAYKKNGKLRHRYVDTKPEKIIPPTDNLYPEAAPTLTPAIPPLETQFIPNHPVVEQREPTAVSHSEKDDISF